VDTAPQSLKLVYVLGTNFCGSTLLSLIMGSHPKVESLGQMFELPMYQKENSPCQCGEVFRTCPFWGRVLLRTGYVDAEGHSVAPMPSEVRYGDWLFRLTKMVRSAAPPDVKAYREFNQSLLAAIHEMTGRRVFMDSSKMPCRLEWLLRSEAVSVGDLRVIHLIRDGRGVVSGYKRRGQSVIRGTLAWWRRHREIGRFARRFAGGPILRLHYEDLARNPEATAREVCQFVGIGFDPAMLAFRSRVQHQLGGNPIRFETSQDIRLDERWRRELTSRDLRVFRLLAGRTQEALGYPC